MRLFNASCPSDRPIPRLIRRARLNPSTAQGGSASQLCHHLELRRPLARKRRRTQVFGPPSAAAPFAELAAKRRIARPLRNRRNCGEAQCPRERKEALLRRLDRPRAPISAGL